MNQARYKLRDIAPPVPSSKASIADKIWLLNLDQIESGTGNLLSRLFVSPDEIGNSTHAFDEGNVLFSKLRPYLNKVYKPEAFGFCTSELVPLRPDHRLVTRDYLAAYLRSPKFLEWVSQQTDGAKMPRVSMKIFWKHEVSLPSLDEQQRIAAILDKADSLRRKRQEAIRLADEFLRAAFYEKCGDPVVNSMDWPEKTVSEISVITTGNTPSRDIDDYFGDAIEWIKSDNINTPSHILTKAREGLSDLGKKVGRMAPEGSTLMTCIAGSASCIGNVALADRKVAFNQQINAITPAPGVDPEFLYTLLLLSKPRIQAASTNSMKGMISKGTLEKIRLIWPSADIQKDIANILRQTQRLLVRMEDANPSALFNALQERLLAPAM